MRRFVVLVLALTGCGGTLPASTTPAPETTTEPTTASWSERAKEAFARGDFERAMHASVTALQLDPADDDAKEIQALIYLARRSGDGVLNVLRGSPLPAHVKLRARAQMIRRDYPALAAELSGLSAEHDDAWTAEIRAIASAMGRHTPYALADSFTGARIPYAARRGASGAPTIDILVSGERVPALIVTSSYLCLVDRSLEAASGRIASVVLGDGADSLAVGNVPAISTDLSALGTSAGAPKFVIGLDLLLRLHAVLDGPGGALVFERECDTMTGVCGDTREFRTPRQDAQTGAALLTMNGTMFVVEARAENAEGLFLVDTAQGFPVALLDSVATAIDHDPSTLARVEGAPEGVRAFGLETFELAHTAVEGVPAFTGVVPATLSTQARVPVIGVVGEPFLRQFVVRFDEDRHTVSFDVPSTPAP